MQHLIYDATINRLRNLHNNANQNKKQNRNILFFRYAIICTSDETLLCRGTSPVFSVHFFNCTYILKQIVTYHFSRPMVFEIINRRIPYFHFLWPKNNQARPTQHGKLKTWQTLHCN